MFHFQQTVSSDCEEFRLSPWQMLWQFLTITLLGNTGLEHASSHLISLENWSVVTPYLSHFVCAENETQP